MEPTPAPDPEALALAQAGPERDRRFAEAFERHRARLERAVAVRLAPALAARVGASDVVAEAWAEARERLPEWVAAPRVPLFVWLRFLALQRLRKAWRQHATAQRRSLRREVAGDAPADPVASSAVLADHLAASTATPSVLVGRTETRARLRAALDAMAPGDREVLALRHFEELTNAEVAEVLGLSVEAASKRYVRALERLGTALRGGPPDGTAAP